MSRPHMVCVLVLWPLALGCGKSERPPPSDPRHSSAAPSPNGDLTAQPQRDEPPDQDEEPRTAGEEALPGGTPAPLEEAAAPEDRGAGAVQDPCAALVTREYALIRASGTEEMRAAVSATPEAATLAKCRASPPPERVVGCALEAPDALTLYRTCYALPFEGRALTIGRTFEGLEDNSGADPPLFSQDGDTMTFGDCRMIHQLAGLFRGFFISCNGKTIGPITTGDDIKAAMAALAAESAAGHKAVMDIIANYPTGRSGQWKVCDSVGNCRIE